MYKERIVTDVINEMNNLALSLDGPKPLITWTIINVPFLMDCEFSALALVYNRHSLLNYSSAVNKGNPLFDSFKKIAKQEIQKVINSNILDLQEFDTYIEEGSAGNIKGELSSINSFYSFPLELKDKTIGYMAIGSSQKNAFVKFKLNIFKNFCNQLALGLRSLIDRDMLIEQSHLLEKEKRKVEEEKKTIEAIVGGMKEGLIITDGMENIITINDAALVMLGLKRDPGNRSARNFILENLLKEASKDEYNEKIIELSIPKKSVVHIGSTPIFSDGDKFMGRATLLTDITKEKEIEQLKSDFLNAVNHELRTPLTSIREIISIIAEGAVGPVNEKQIKCLKTAISDSDRLGRIVNDLLDLSKIESGKIHIKRSPVAISRIVTKVMESFEQLAKTNKIELKGNFPDSLPSVFADPDKIIQVLTNLIGNAMKFTPPGGNVTVTCNVSPVPGDADKKYMEISVSDTGLGISAEDQKKLFKKFSQLESGFNHKSGGTGLGLVISKEIVERHGGRIWIESELYKGAAFLFTIPIFEETSAYLVLIQQEIDRVKKDGTDLSLILIKPKFGKKSADKNKSAVNYLYEFCKKSMRRKDDQVLIYHNEFVIIIAESGKENSVSLAERLRVTSEIQFDYKITTYPNDGASSIEIFNKLENGD